MAKIKIKLNSKRSTTVRATDGAYYKLRAGENIIELEPKAYSALMSALGIKSNNKKQADPKPVEQPKEQCVVNNEQSENTTSEPVVEPIVETAVEPVVDNQEQTICTGVHESCEVASEVIADEPDNAEDNDDNADENDTVDKFSQMSYSQLKTAYRETTGKNSKLKRKELINFLREHSNAE